MRQNYVGKTYFSVFESSKERGIKRDQTVRVSIPSFSREEDEMRKLTIRIRKGKEGTCV